MCLPARSAATGAGEQTAATRTTEMTAASPAQGLAAASPGRCVVQSGQTTQTSAFPMTGRHLQPRSFGLIAAEASKSKQAQESQKRPWLAWRKTCSDSRLLLHSLSARLVSDLWRHVRPDSPADSTLLPHRQQRDLWSDSKSQPCSRC